MKYAIVLSLMMASELTYSLRLNNAVDFSETSQAEKPSDLAHVYVINLDKRVDRCECMRSQLVQSPFPVYRQMGIERNDVANACPTVKERAQSIHAHWYNKTWAAIFCSNKVVMERALKAPVKPKYIVVMEDDIYLREPFFTELHNTLKNDCLHATPWDVMAVDTFNIGAGNPGKKGRLEFAECKKDVAFAKKAEDQALSRIFKMSPEAYGAHVQIIKTSSLEKLLTRRVNSIDHWADFKNQTTIFWLPKLVSQPANTYKAPPGCEKSVEKNDHRYHTFKSSESESERDFFSCP